jgi:hypothetical protein
MKKNTLLPSLALLLLSFFSLPVISTSQALLINLGLDEVRNFSGNSTATSTLALLVVDKNLSGTFETPQDGWSTAVGSFGSDFIAWRGNFSPSATAGVFLEGISISIGTADVPANSAFGLYWFPTLTTGSATLTAGTTYGFYTSTNGTQFGSDSGWNTGSNDAATLTINAYTINNTGNLATNPEPSGLSDASLQANLTVIPEPSTWILIGLGLASIIILRRRRMA